MVQFYINGGFDDDSNWTDGHYRISLPNRYSDGKLFRNLRKIIHEVKECGMQFIPGISIPGSSVANAWGIPRATNISNMSCYALDPAMPCIASGLTAHDVILEPNGFQTVFTEAMKVLYAAYDAEYPNAMDYINLHFSECILNDPVRMIFGTAGINGVNIDKQFMDDNNKSVAELVVESINRRVLDLRSCGKKFSSTKVMIYGDMYSSTFQQAKRRNSGLVATTALPSLVKNSVTFTKSVIVIPWWYDQCLDGVATCAETDVGDFKTANMLREFTDNNLKVCPMYCISENTGTPELQICQRYVREAFEYMSAVKMPQITNNVIGFAAAHWDYHGYDGGRLTWNTLEYLAYGNQAARPQTQFSLVPAGAKGQVKIDRLSCSQTEITQGDYLSVTGKFMFNNNNCTGRLDHPVENVTFYDAVIYCNARSEVDGLVPVYSYGPVSASDYKGETCKFLKNLKADLSKSGYRLPSNAEWKYIYGAGSLTDYYWGPTNDTAYYWCRDNAAQSTMPVRSKIPNEWDIYDIAGNVAELSCEYVGGAVSTVKYGGGSTNDKSSNPCFMHTSQLRAIDLDEADPHVGFRIVRKATDKQR